MQPNSGVLIIVENLTVPLDRRVWQEAQALRQAGYNVSVVCPKGGVFTKSYEVRDGIHIFRHPMPFEADGALGYLFEYLWALAWELALSIKAYFKVGFDVVQACNPPDLIFLIGGFWKYLFGKAFIFDHHDINPELYEAKFGRRDGFYRILKIFERWTFRTSDASIATNETFKKIAIRRGGMAPDDVFVVRSIPDLSRFQRVAANAELRNGRRFAVGYVGIMGAQDGVDLLIESMHHLVHGEGRDDVQAVIVGSGTELAALKSQARRLGLEDHVTFTGFLSGASLMSALSTFDVGVIPDPKNTYNDKISMNKVFEYMSLGIPFVQFDLTEGRAMAGDAALYAKDNNPVSLAETIAQVLDDEAMRKSLATVGRESANRLLCWDAECGRLLAAYDKALGSKEPALQRPVPVAGE